MNKIESNQDFVKSLKTWFSENLNNEKLNNSNILNEKNISSHNLLSFPSFSNDLIINLSSSKESSNINEIIIPNKLLEINNDKKNMFIKKDVEFIEHKENLLNLLNEWIWVKQNVSVSIIGKKGVGKTFLTNVLLEASFQDIHINSINNSNSLIIDKNFYLIEDEKDKNLFPEIYQKFFDKETNKFLINDDFSLTVNWEGEKESKKNLKDYFKTSRFHNIVTDRHSYILPQGPFKGFCCKNFTITYGKISELIITFISENKIRENLWKLHEHLGDINDEDMFLNQLKKQYRFLLNIPKDQQIPLKNIISQDFLPISEEYRNLLGHSLHFKGNGIDPNLDRIYIREKILEMINKYDFIIENMFLIIPCGIFKGNIEFNVIDVDIINSLEFKKLENSNLLLVAIDNKGLTQDLCILLKSIGFLEKLIYKNNEHKIIFLDMSENEQVVSPLSAHHMFHFKTKEQIQLLRKQILSELSIYIKQFLLEKGHKFSSLSHTVDKVLQAINILPVKPLLFLSINSEQNNQDFEKIGLSKHEIKKKTNIPTLLAAIQNILFSKSARPLNEFNKNWLAKAKHKISNINEKNSYSLPSTHLISTEEHLMKSLRKKLKRWKNLIQDCEKSIFSLLQQKLKECNNNIFFTESALDIFTKFIPSYWEKNIIGKLALNSESIIKCAYKFLDKCTNFVVFTSSNKAKEKARLFQILKICKNSVENTIKNKVNNFYKHIQEIDFYKIVKDIFLEQREAVNINKKTYFQITQQTVKNIFIHFSNCLNFGIKQLEVIENHIGDCARCLLYSSYLKASQIMNFLIHSQIQYKNISNNKMDIERVSNNLNEMDNNERDIDEPILFKEDLWNKLVISKENNIEKFEEQLKKLTMTISKVENDHNNQFRTFSKLLYGTEDGYPVIKLLLMNELLENSSLYGDLFVNKGINIDEYVYNMSNNENNGDYITLLAFSNFSKTDLLIYSSKYIHPILIQPQKNKKKETFYIAYIGNNEYQPLIKNIDPLIKILNIEEELQKLHIIEDIEEQKIINTNSKKRNILIDNNDSNNNKVKQKKIEINKRISIIPTLSNLCLNVICDYANDIPSLEGNIPEEIIQKIINKLIIQGKLNQNILEHLLEPFFNNLNLKNYKFISLSSCKLIGDRCKLLRKLDLSNCININSESITYISKSCTNLEEINLENCYLLENNSIQSLARYCYNLIYVNLSFCYKITDIGIQELTISCKNLKELYLSNCSNLTDFAFHFIENKLYNLDISECNLISRNGMIEIAKHSSKLIFIKLSGKNVDDLVIYTFVTRCPNLKIMQLLRCENITNQAIQSILTYNPDIIQLSLNWCKKISDTAFLHEKKFLNLTHLDLSRCLDITSETVKIISHFCTKLQFISLNSCEDINEESLIMLANFCKELRFLDLSSCSHVNEEFINILALNCKHLQKLILFNCSGITNSCLKWIGYGLPKLIELNVSSCKNISDDGLLYIGNGCSILKILNLEECNITDKGITTITSFCPSLEMIKLAYCKDLTDISLHSFIYCQYLTTLDLSYINHLSISILNKCLSSCTQLISLSLRGWSNIKHEGIKHATLRYLDLSWCSSLLDLSVIHTIDKCSKLEILNLSWCTNITSNAIHHIAATSNHIHQLNIRGCHRISNIIINVLSSTNKIVIK